MPVTLPGSEVIVVNKEKTIPVFLLLGKNTFR